MFLPELIEQSRADASLRLRFLIDPALAYFTGHFADWPILPGIVQIHWAIEYARKHWNCRGPCQRLENVKFHRIVRTGIELSLTLKYDAAKSRLDFLYDNAAHKYSSGVAFFTAV
jgi:3-hydroxymyristoyl/3-hydroxydecanoyl-(acyl carrier protein) dehydratase